MPPQKPVSVREALGGQQRPRRPRPQEDPWARLYAHERQRLLGWSIEHTQRQHSLRWVGQGVEEFVSGLSGAAPHLWDTDLWSEW